MSTASDPPPLRPMIDGPASGLRVTPCMTAPAAPQAAAHDESQHSPREPHIAGHEMDFARRVVVQYRIDDLAEADFRRANSHGSEERGQRDRRTQGQCRDKC